MTESKSITEHQHICDVLIIGAGAAGLSLALKLAPYTNVTVLSKGKLSEGSTFYAQGGVAAVFSDTDSIDSHVEDTLIAGAGLCDEEAVRFTLSHAKESMQWLIDIGVDFDTEVDDHGQAQYHLTREGGHSHRRILHAADATGREIENTLLCSVKKQKNIHLMEGYNAVDLITSRKLTCPPTGYWGLMSGTVKQSVLKQSKPISSFLQPAAPVKYTNTQATRMFPAEMASPWPGAAVAESPIWNLINSTPPVYFTVMLKTFY